MRIVIIDDDNLVGISLKTILEANQEVEVLAIGNNGKEGILLYEKYQPDVLLMDIRMDIMTGIDAAKIIIEKDKNAKILFLTTFLDDDYIIKALQLGAKGYILKQDFESILPALKAVYSGQNVFGDKIISKIPSFLDQKKALEDLPFSISQKELELIRLVADGLSNKEISQKLYLSEGTIRNYLSNILEKLDLRDRTQLAVFYYQNHLDLYR
ncbi:response regulator [Anaerosacchariphilus polymeriproducens]|uniref:Stage 0 sporulation protein A homolog n=1 Tax=Anaerosacchariphilus polymeriproducens TaxID=1812858 RepID=A0A371ATD4_9FIRM|nr:response regulator transcription factor [Anaerosacchariphilus polymeriproducens]RDU22833.1 DNA-binding response regulator [Anaerosacchariphilus polymeriproducens]